MTSPASTDAIKEPVHDRSESLRANIWANLIGKAWTAIAYVVLVPVYVHFLGIQAWGLVGLYLALQTLASLLDLGVTATVNRELARHTVGESTTGSARDLVRTLELCYVGIATVMALATVGASGYLARNWVQADGLSPTTIHHAIALMGVVLALQWLFGFYAGGLYGLKRQVLLNVILVAGTTVRNVGSAVILWLVSPSIVTFFVWQAIASALQVAATAYALWHNLPSQGERARFRMTVVRSGLSFALGVSGISIFAVAFTQLDKIILSRLLSLSDFGYYTLAAAAAAALYYVAGPIFQAVFPHFSSFVAAGPSRRALLKKHYHDMCQLLSVLTIPASVVAIVFAGPLLIAWTGSQRTADHTDILLALLVGGSALNALMQVPYALQLAYGWTKLGLVQNAASAIVLIPLLVVVTTRWGGIGAASVWLSLNLGYALIGIQIMHRRLLRGELGHWYLVDVGLPLLAALVVAVLARIVYDADGASRAVAAVWLGAVFATASIASMLATPMTRTRVIRWLPLPLARRASVT